MKQLNSAAVRVLALALLSLPTLSGTNGCWAQATAPSANAPAAPVAGAGESLVLSPEYVKAVNKALAARHDV